MWRDDGEVANQGDYQVGLQDEQAEIHINILIFITPAFSFILSL